MEGRLTLQDVRLMCVLGVYPHERQQPQAVELTLSFQLKVPQHDNLEETLDYDKIALLCQEVAHQGEFRLIESLAQAIYQTLMERFKLQHLRVRIYKLGVPQHAAGVAFEVGA